MKKLTNIILSLTIMFCFCLSSVACDEMPDNVPDPGRYDEYKEMSMIYPENVDGSYVNLNSEMTALQMFDTANENMDKVGWMSLISVGSAETDIKDGKIKMSQDVFTHKIIENKEDGYFYATTSSITADTDSKFIKMLNMRFVKSYYRDNSTGKHYFVEGKSDIHYTDEGLVDADSFGKVKVYNSEQELVDDGNTNNPFIFGVYEINENTVTDKQLVHNDEEGYWTVRLSLDVEKATEQYVEVMKEMIIISSEISFDYCTIEYNIWDNGLLKESSISESYLMEIASMNIKIKNESTVFYTYDENNFDVENYKDRFGF